MSSTPALQVPSEAAQHANNTQYYRQVLHELIDMGADLARNVHQQARPHAPARTPAPILAPACPNDPTIAFDRIARCVRRTIALARTLAQPLPPRPGQHGLGQHGLAQQRTSARKRIIRAVEDVIHRRTDGPHAESLHAGLSDRLDSPDLDDDIASRPVAEIINEICRDLGLADMPGNRPLKRRTAADVANLHARAAQPCHAPRLVMPRLVTPQAVAPDPSPPTAEPGQPAASAPPAAHAQPADHEPASPPAEPAPRILHDARPIQRE